jgi:hypothetical protein
MMIANTYLFSIMSVLLALIFHFISWRYWSPKNPTLALAGVFLFFGFLIYAFFLIDIFFNVHDINLITLLSCSFGYWLSILAVWAAYVCFYSAIEVDSPSLTIIKIILKRNGVHSNPKEIEIAFCEHKFIESRINHLLSDGIAIHGEFGIKLTKKGRYLCSLLGLYGFLIGRQKGEG